MQADVGTGDESAYPHPVNYRGWDLAGVVALNGFFVVVMLAMGAFAAVGLSTAGRSSTTLASLIPLTIFLPVAALFGWRLWRLMFPALTLYADRIERRRWNGDLISLGRDRIKGLRKVYSNRGYSTLELTPALDGEKPIRFDSRLRSDPVFDRWLSGLHDLDADALAADKAEILTDARYGATEAERAGRLAWARKLVLGFSGVCLGAAAWIFLVPEPEPVRLTVAAAPLLAAAFIVQSSNGLIVWFAVNRARPMVVAAWAPLAALSFHGFPTHLIDPGHVLVQATAFAAVATAGLWWLRSEPARRRLALGLGMAAGFGVYGLTAELDSGLDRSAAKVFPAVVQGRHVSSGRSTTYYLNVAPWSDQPGGDIAVPSRYYYRIQPGAVVCMSRRLGALGIGWFEVGDCPPGLDQNP